MYLKKKGISLVSDFLLALLNNLGKISKNNWLDSSFTCNRQFDNCLYRAAQLY